MTMNEENSPTGPDQTGAPAAPETPQSEPAMEGDQRPSRKASLLAMGGVAVALALIWLAPGINEPRSSPTQTGAASASGGESEEGDMTGKPAPLQFTLKDMNGADVTLAS